MADSTTSAPESAQAAWPTSAAMIGCDPVAVCRSGLVSAFNDAPYANGNDPVIGQIQFWRQMADIQAPKLAEWAVNSLGITGRAQPVGAATDEQVAVLARRVFQRVNEIADNDLMDICFDEDARVTYERMVRTTLELSTQTGEEA